MQIDLVSVGVLLVIIGILIMIAALFQVTSTDESDEKVETKSQGIILLGPIPIVWGFGNKTKLVWLLVLIVAFMILIIAIAK